MAVVAGTVAAMKTDSRPAVSPTPQNLFLLALGELLVVLRKAFLPHLAAGLGLFLMTAYVTYAFLLQPAHLPPRRSRMEARTDRPTSPNTTAPTTMVERLAVKKDSIAGLLWAVTP